ncbi:MAG: DUF4294 domain-containing protein [Bacteroidota bacterium]|nr:DUF4294 domain-containing protein [Bacteroidota bacterium]
MKLGLFIFLTFSNLILYAQNEKQNFSISPVDTVPLNLILPDHQVYTSDNEFLKKWNKTKFYVRSVYDYAKIASSMLEGFNDTLALLSNNRIKKRYLKRANKMLKNEFGDEIRKMSINRGTHLMKLIYRNTGLTTYDIIKLYRGSGKAFWFQTLCLVNGQNLKKEYDPEGEDYLIEKAVSLIESGRMNYFKRVPHTESGKKAVKSSKKKRRSKKD